MMQPQSVVFNNTFYRSLARNNLIPFISYGMNFLIKLILSAIAVILASYILPGIEVLDFFSALLFAALLALLNATVKPLLITTFTQ